MQDQPFAPTEFTTDRVAACDPPTTNVQIAIGCGALLLMFCLPLAAIGWYTLSYEAWIQKLDGKAKEFDGYVYKGRRASSSDLLISCNAPTTMDADVPQIVALGAECLAGGARKLHIDLSKTTISDDSIGQFAALRIETLDLSDTRVSRCGAADLRVKMPTTEIKDRHNAR